MTVAVQVDLLASGSAAWAAPPSTARVRTLSAATQHGMDRWAATPVFDAYWLFAARRQNMLLRRLSGSPPPWTDDPVLARHRFTNPYRFTDRVSQNLLRQVQYNREWAARDLVFRTLLFKVFNRTTTWSSLRDAVGEPTIDTFDVDAYGRVLTDLRDQGHRVYSAAYIVPNPALGQPVKHLNHLRLIESMLNDGVVDRLADATGLQDLYGTLIQVPSFGPFLSFQYAVDINYSTVTGADESDFVVAGPGARDGLRKCFPGLSAGAETEAIMWVTQTQDEHLARLGLRLQRPFDRPLQPIDCQNLFCEVDKYARVVFPTVAGVTGRSRIKRGFAPVGREPLAGLFCPPKWLRAQSSTAAAMRTNARQP